MVVQKPFQFDWNRVYIRKRCANKQKSIQWRWAHSMPYELQSRSNNNNRCRPTDDTMSQWKSEWERTKKLPIHSVLSARRDEKITHRSTTAATTTATTTHGTRTHINIFALICLHFFVRLFFVLNWKNQRWNYYCIATGYRPQYFCAFVANDKYLEKFSK